MIAVGVDREGAQVPVGGQLDRRALGISRHAKHIGRVLAFARIGPGELTGNLLQAADAHARAGRVRQLDCLAIVRRLHFPRDVDPDLLSGRERNRRGRERPLDVAAVDGAVDLDLTSGRRGELV